MSTYGNRKDTNADAQEHVDVNGVQAKRTLMSGWDGTNINDVAINSNGRIETAGIVPEEFDYMDLDYTGSDLTGIVYKTGGSGGTTVATLTLGYGSGNLTSITRT